MKTSSVHNQPSENDLSPREIGVAHNVVSDFLNKHHSFRGYDFEDLLQECLLHWIARRHQYKPDRGASRSTFMGKILKRKLLDILAEQMSHKRRVNQLSDPLEPPSDDESSEREPMPIFQSPDIEKSRIFLHLDVEKVLADLHPDQFRLCELMKEEMNVTEIARELNKPRSTIYDELNRIKEIFNKEGLHDFI